MVWCGPSPVRGLGQQPYLCSPHALHVFRMEAEDDYLMMEPTEDPLSLDVKEELIKDPLSTPVPASAPAPIPTPLQRTRTPVNRCVVFCYIIRGII